MEVEVATAVKAVVTLPVQAMLTEMVWLLRFSELCLESFKTSPVRLIAV